MKRLLLAGAGNAHLEVLRQLARRRMKAHVILVTPEARVLYSGMVPGFIAGQYARADCEIDVGSLATSAGIELRTAAITSVDTKTRVARCSDGKTLPFDIMSINTGSASFPEAFRENPVLLPIRPLSRFVAEFHRLTAGHHRLRIVIVGGGPAAVEIALAVREKAGRRETNARVDVSIVTDTDAITPRFPRSARTHLALRCRDAGIDLATGTNVACNESGLLTGNGSPIAADVAFWAGGASAANWFRDGGLAVDNRGFIVVDETLQSMSHQGIFAVGEAAALDRWGRRHSGVHAVRQGPVLAYNLYAMLDGQPLRRYVPQRLALSIMRTGKNNAIAVYGPLSVNGSWVWHWKDRIDRTYVESFRTATSS